MVNVAIKAVTLVLFGTVTAMVPEPMAAGPVCPGRLYAVISADVFDDWAAKAGAAIREVDPNSINIVINK